MLKIWRELTVGLIFTVMLGCSMQQRPVAQTHDLQNSGIQALIDTCGETKTTMALPNGNMLYVFGAGSHHVTAVPVRTVPGHELAMLSEDDKPAKIVKAHNRIGYTPQRESQERIVWIETNPSGSILLAGCAGCTTEENRMLAKAGHEGNGHGLLSGLLRE